MPVDRVFRRRGQRLRYLLSAVVSVPLAAAALDDVGLAGAALWGALGAWIAVITLLVVRALRWMEATPYVELADDALIAHLGPNRPARRVAYDDVVRIDRWPGGWMRVVPSRGRPLNLRRGVFRKGEFDAFRETLEAVTGESRLA